MTVDDFLVAKAAKSEAAMRHYLSHWTNSPPNLLTAIEYSLFAGGKRLRPGLVLGAADVVAGDDTPAIPAACAVEMIHTYSLIHDDLPCMDDDDLRRGKPTAHKVFGEAMAILAGDALLTMAFDVAAETGNIAVIRELARASGVEGMAGGQVVDLESENKSLALEELKQLHARKTGALIRSSVRCGAMLAGASDAQLNALSLYGEAIGLAFQIADDILDIVGSEDKLGKKPGGDVANKKSTYPALLGVDGARELAEEAMQEAIASLESFGSDADQFRDLARFIVYRET
ncbi:MAG: hypothetical protein AMXMBFR84_02740 [Candidatus Hydrogenedentota bacterium]